jgi:hypothetical protein
VTVCYLVRMVRGRWRRTASSRGPVLAVLGAALVVGGCHRFRGVGPTPGGTVGNGAAVGGGADESTSPELPKIGLQRGGHWSVLTIRPPHLNGQQFHLQLKNSVLTGAISGGDAPGGVLRVSIKEDGAEGFGPLGPVSLDFSSDEISTTAEGMWNGGRVHLVFSHDSLKGTVATNSFFSSKSNPADNNNREMRQMGAFGQKSADMMDPLPVDMSCEYFLDHVTSDGALNGGSTCSGMPQPTRLEVPKVAQAWLTRAELVTILVAVLSSPPVAVSEQYGPRIDPPSTQNPLRR